MLTGIIRDKEEDDEDETAADDEIDDAAASGHVPVSSPKNSRPPTPVERTRDGDSPQKEPNTAASSTSDSSADSSSSTTSSSSGSSSSESEETTSEQEDVDESPTSRLKNRAMKSMKSKQREKEAAMIAEKSSSPVYNYVFFDPEQHWCAICNVFPKSARDYLNHLHTQEHMNQETVETPWHLDVDHDPFPMYADAPLKRVPVRGMEFLVPASAWFCKLCSFWIGDLHCASAHLKSKTHSQRYEMFLKPNPDYEARWLADREKALQAYSKAEQEKQYNKSKKDEEKSSSKKRKKKNIDKKDKKRKKRKHSKKHKKQSAGGGGGGTGNSSSSSSDNSSSSDEETVQKPKKSHEEPMIAPIAVPAGSIRVTMRKQENPITPTDVEAPAEAVKDTDNSYGRLGRWTVAQEGIKPATVPVTTKADVEDDKRRDESIIQQWNTVQPVISESEKKLLEQLKGKLKHKREGDDTTMTNAVSSSRDKNDDKGASKRQKRSPAAVHSWRSVSRSRSRGRAATDYRGGGGGGDYRRGRGARSRTRSRSRGRRRRTRSPPPTRGRGRSRSRDTRRRRTRSRSRSRSGSRSGRHIEKPIVKHSEFRSRAMIERNSNNKSGDGSSSNSKSKRDASSTKSKSSSSSSASAAAASTAAAAAAATGGKKLPFIGKMPVFKKQNQSGDSAAAALTGDSHKQYMNGTERVEHGSAQQPIAVRPPAPTAAQIQMAMMEDVYGNAPPFHPEAGMMVDYDELMPDPVQFANLMTHGPPPPPPPPLPTRGKDIGSSANEDGNCNDMGADDDDEDVDGVEVLPPGIDEADAEHVPMPLAGEAPTRDGELPKDLAAALDIIFPSDKPFSDDPLSEEDISKKSNNQDVAAGVALKTLNEQQQLQDHLDNEAMQLQDLAKQGIHLVTIQEAAMNSTEQSGLPAHLQPQSALHHEVAIVATLEGSPMDICMDEESIQGNLNIVHNIAGQISNTNGADSDNEAVYMAYKSATDGASVAAPIISSPDQSLQEQQQQSASMHLIPNDIPMPQSPPPPPLHASAVNAITIAPAASAAATGVDTISTKIRDAAMSMTTSPPPSPVPTPAAIMFDLKDIPEPPPASPTDSEKLRRQAELEELAMLGIDTSDMAAQCM